MLNSRSSFQFRGGKWKPSNRDKLHEVWMSCNKCHRFTPSQVNEDIDLATTRLLKWATLAGWARIDSEEFCPACALEVWGKLDGVGGRGGTTT